MICFSCSFTSILSILLAIGLWSTCFQLQSPSQRRPNCGECRLYPALEKVAKKMVEMGGPFLVLFWDSTLIPSRLWFSSSPSSPKGLWPDSFPRPPFFFTCNDRSTNQIGNWIKKWNLIDSRWFSGIVCSFCFVEICWKRKELIGCRESREWDGRLGAIFMSNSPLDRSRCPSMGGLV